MISSGLSRPRNMRRYRQVKIQGRGGVAAGVVHHQGGRGRQEGGLGHAGEVLVVATDGRRRHVNTIRMCYLIYIQRASMPYPLIFVCPR